MFQSVVLGRNKASVLSCIIWCNNMNLSVIPYFLFHEGTLPRINKMEESSECNSSLLLLLWEKYIVTKFSIV